MEHVVCSILALCGMVAAYLLGRNHQSKVARPAKVAPRPEVKVEPDPVDPRCLAITVDGATWVSPPDYDHGGWRRTSDGAEPDYPTSERLSAAAWVALASLVTGRG